MRSGGRTKSGEPSFVTLSTNAMIAFFGAVSFHDGSGSAACPVAASSNEPIVSPCVQPDSMFISLVASSSLADSWLQSPAENAFEIMNRTARFAIGPKSNEDSDAQSRFVQTA